MAGLAAIFSLHSLAMGDDRRLAGAAGLAGAPTGWTARRRRGPDRDASRRRLTPTVRRSARRPPAVHHRRRHRHRRGRRARSSGSSGDPGRPPTPSARRSIEDNFYDLQARAMFHGHLWLANGAIGIEAFVHGGRPVHLLRAVPVPHPHAHPARDQQPRRQADRAVHAAGLAAHRRSSPPCCCGGSACSSVARRSWAGPRPPPSAC